jgi:hypothetical protein
MNLTPGVTIEANDVVTRQTIYDLWADAQGGQIVAGDLSATLFPIVVGTNPTSSITPGQIWYDQAEMLWKVFIDVKDNTGVSVWVAFGPDRFDEVFLANEHLPPAALFKLDDAGTGRMVKRVSGFADSHAVGLVATNATVPSGTWFAGAIEGFANAWFPFKPASDASAQVAGAVVNQSLMPINWAPGGLGRSAGGNLQNEFIVGVGTHAVEPSTTVSNGNYIERILFTGSRYTKR